MDTMSWRQPADILTDDSVMDPGCQQINDNGSLYLSVTPKFYTTVLHQTTGLTPN